MSDLTIVKIVYGSHLYGTGTPESDVDYKGIFLPSTRKLLLNSVPKSIRQNDLGIDYELYSIFRFLSLALEGQTVAIEMLHTPSEFIISTSDTWKELVSQRQKFYHKNLNAFIGYAMAQATKWSLKGNRLREAERFRAILLGQSDTSMRLSTVWHLLENSAHSKHLPPDPNGILLYEICGRKFPSEWHISDALKVIENIINTYGERAKASREGVDWKALSHAFRVAYELKELIEDRTITFPRPERDFLIRIKKGEVDFESASTQLEDLVNEVEILMSVSNLPEKPDRIYWEEWLYNTIKDKLS